MVRQQSVVPVLFPVSFTIGVATIVRDTGNLQGAAPFTAATRKETVQKESRFSFNHRLTSIQVPRAASRSALASFCTVGTPVWQGSCYILWVVNGLSLCSLPSPNMLSTPCFLFSVSLDVRCTPLTQVLVSSNLHPL